jgi:hypothetical protein
MEALAAIEKLINKKLERVLVAGYANAGTVATMVSEGHGGSAGRSRPENHRRPERDRRPQQQKPQHANPQHANPQHAHATAPQSTPHQAAPQARAAQKYNDPIFSKPYEPGVATISPKPAEEPVGLGKRRDRPVAALLGGLKRA